jgi:hypothetical protein
MMDDMLQPGGALSPFDDNAWIKTLREDPSPAESPAAEKASGYELKLHPFCLRKAGPGHSDMPAVNAARLLSEQRTSLLVSPRSSRNNDDAFVLGNGLDDQSGRDQGAQMQAASMMLILLKNQRHAAI